MIRDVIKREPRTQLEAWEQWREDTAQLFSHPVKITVESVEDHYAILSIGEKLPEAVIGLIKALDDLDLDDNQRQHIAASLSSLKGLAKYARAQANKVAETRP